MAVLIFAVNARSQAIEISSFEDLLKIGADADFPLYGSYELTGDIDASPSRELDGGRGWVPVGRRVRTHMDGFAEVLDTAAAFTGRFDGKGFTISGLYINRASASIDSGFNIGLFGYAHGAQIVNLSVDADSVAGDRYVGALVGRMFSTRVENCYSAGRVAGDTEAGGLIGGLDVGPLGAEAAVISSYSSADVRGNSDIGGLVGVNEGGRIIGCYTTGTVVGAAGGRRVGGLVGHNNSLGTVSSSYSFAAVSGGTAVGGFVGENGGLASAVGGTVTISYSAGQVSGVSDVGGFAGVNNTSAVISFCFWDTERSGQSASDGGSGRTTAQMIRDSVYMAPGAGWNFVTDAVWGWANNYPYIKSAGVPVCTMTFRAVGPGGKLSGRTTQDSTLHTQIVNKGIGGAGVTASPRPGIGESFDGWYLAGSDEKLVSGEYEGFTVTISAGDTTITLSEISGNADMEARFTLMKYDVVYTAGVNGRIGIVNSPGDTTFFAPSDSSRHTIEYGALGPLVVAVPNTGFNFSRWRTGQTNIAGTTAARRDTVWNDTSFSAVFISDSVKLTYGVVGNGRLRLNNAGAALPPSRIPFDTTVVFGGRGPSVEALPLAVPANDWHFVRWSDGRTENPRVDSLVSWDVEADAIFEINNYVLTYIGGPGGKVVTGEWVPPEVDDGGGGDTGGDDTGGGDDVVDGGGDDGIVDVAPLIFASANDGDSAAVPVDTLVHVVPYNTHGPLVTAVPDEGYIFVGWSDGVTTAARSDSLAMNGDSTIIAVFQEDPVSVKEIARVIPAGADVDAAVIAPAVITAGLFTAGPNPVSRQSGKAAFFWQGRGLKDGKLSVYSANGGLVKRIDIRDNSVGGSGRRQVGAWDLTDRKGRPAADGTYLVRGTLTRSDGVRERVSIIVGIR
jgi:hypothetical protein